MLNEVVNVSGPLTQHFTAKLVHQLQSIMASTESMFAEQLEQLQQFQDTIASLESTLQSKDEEYCDEILLQNHEYALWECMLQSDCSLRIPITKSLVVPSGPPIGTGDCPRPPGIRNQRRYSVM